ncbi:MAG: aminopeptidase P family N-terminal domain-containing protein, partial [Eubacterium sp.]|nr:aminopeptidase P family N-terminal domain-containing protein [Eubacterium sp.]
MADNKAMIHERLEALRGEMRKVSADYFLITSSDYHASEYVGDFFKVTEYFSGCTSDNVVMIVDASSAKLWTDGRYFISAAGELEGTEVELMKMGEPGVPTVPAYLQSVIRKGQVLAFDGRCVTSGAGKLYRAIAEKAGATVNGTFCPQDTIWNDRPALSSHPVFLITAEEAGESYEEKAARVRKKTEEAGAATLILSKLDDICWLLNMRGGDVDYNPVALSYFILGQTSAHLFIQESELTDEFRAYAESNKIELHPYDAIFAFVKENTFDGAVLADPTGTSDTMLHLLQEKGVKVIEAENPTAIMKALKNETELTRSREAYLLDSVAVCRFIYWVKKNIGTIPMTEVSAAEYLDHLRSEIPGYIDLSFGTISAYNANAAMAHYAPTA